MRLFIVSSIEDISCRIGFEANQMVRAFALVSRRALTALLRLHQSLSGLGAWKRVNGVSATSIFETLRSWNPDTATPTTPVAALAAIVGNYSLNLPAFLDAATPGSASTDGKYVGTGTRQQDCPAGQRD